MTHENSLDGPHEAVIIPLFKEQTYTIEGNGFQSIVDQDGKRVSDSFHEIKVFEADDPDRAVKFKVYVGRMGACKVILQEPKRPGETFVPPSESIGAHGFHDISYDSNLGTLIGRLGSRTHLLDKKGNASYGAHIGAFSREDDKIYLHKFGTKFEVTPGEKSPEMDSFEALAHRIDRLEDCDSDMGAIEVVERQIARMAAERNAKLRIDEKADAFGEDIEQRQPHTEQMSAKRNARLFSRIRSRILPKMYE
jgi:hypothetical protein